MTEVCSNTNLLVQAIAKNNAAGGNRIIKPAPAISSNFHREEEDTVNIGGEKRVLTKQKIGIYSSIIGIGAIIGAIALHKINKISPEKLQRMLNDIYMREDISVEEASRIMQQYKELEKIQDIDEFAKKAFELVKKNFGLEDKPIEFFFEKTNGKTKGGCHIDNSQIYIKYNEKVKKKNILGLIHHEMRHAKQHWFMFNQFPEYADKKIAKLTFKNMFDEDNAVSRYADSLIEKGTNQVDDLWKSVCNKFHYMIDERIEKYFGKLSQNNVPEKYKDFAKKCMENENNYIKMEDDEKAYRKQFIEKDAYSVQKQILRLLKKF